MSEDQLKKSAYMFSGNAEFIEELYKKYLNGDTDIDQEWKEFFKETGDDLVSLSNDYTKIKWQENASNVNNISKSSNDDIKISSLINNYRRYGHLKANIDPLELSPKK